MLQIVAGLYVIVRGLDNVEKGLENTSLYGLWIKLFAGKQAYSDYVTEQNQTLLERQRNRESENFIDAYLREQREKDAEQIETLSPTPVENVQDQNN